MKVISGFCVCCLSLYKAVFAVQKRLALKTVANNMGKGITTDGKFYFL